MQLTITSNAAANPQTLDLTRYIDVQAGQGMDPYNPAFSNRIISHSLLKEGGVLAMEDLTAKELVFPLKLHAASSSALASLIAQINQIITSPGAIWSWQDDGMSQPTVFDAISGQFDVGYNYREAQKFWTGGNLRLFSQPLGHTVGPRPYAVASGVGPVLMISPYTPSGTLGIGASTQAGVAGFGGAPWGPSSGIFYPGSPSLAGDAGALLQISYAPPFQSVFTGYAPVTPLAVSLLPDAKYQALQTTANITAPVTGPSPISQGSAVAGQYWSMPASQTRELQFSPIPANSTGVPVSWAGPHRLFAIARASQTPGVLIQLPTLSGGLGDAARPAAASVAVGDWSMYDLGTFSLRGSEAPSLPVLVAASAGGTLDVTAMVMVPDRSTWFVGPNVYPLGPGAAGGPAQPRPTILIDDILADQFAYTPSTTLAPTPIGSVPSSVRITQYTRGVVPRLDPKNGLPILAVVSAGIPGQLNPQNQPVNAIVNTLERTKYVLP